MIGLSDVHLQKLQEKLLEQQQTAAEPDDPQDPEPAKYEEVIAKRAESRMRQEARQAEAAAAAAQAAQFEAPPARNEPRPIGGRVPRNRMDTNFIIREVRIVSIHIHNVKRVSQ